MMEANSMIAKKMTLLDAREELERQGFRIIVDESHAAGDEYPPPTASLVGLHTSCRWDMLVKWDVIVVVHEVSVLTLGRLEADLAKLAMQPYVDDLEGGCPPHGFSRGRMTVLAYLARNRIEPEALNRILQTPKAEWCAVVFPAAQNENGVSFYLETTTPFWGRALYPELRYWAGRITGRPLPEHPPGTSTFLRISTAITLVCLVFVIIVNPWQQTLIFTFGFLLVFAIAYCIRTLQRRNARRGQMEMDSFEQHLV